MRDADEALRRGVPVVKGTRSKPESPTHAGLNDKGFELWRGPSAIDGTEIGVVITHAQSEPLVRKLGNMSQAWIMPVATPPIEATRAGIDTSVCGTCRFRPRNGGGCYVDLYSTAQRVWYAWQRNRSYRPLPPGGFGLVDESPMLYHLQQKDCRVGAWGDPAAVPLEVWLPLLAFVPGWTAYTHRWREIDVVDWSWCMASVDNPAQRIDAVSRGWRTFRARLPGTPLQPGEFMCPASDEAGHKLTCDRCGLCNGVRTDAERQPKDPAIIVHGTQAGKARRWMRGEDA